MRRTHLIGTGQQQHEVFLDFPSHLSLPTVEIVLVTREAVDEETVLPRVFHRFLDQRAGDLHRNDSSVPDVALDQVSVFRAWCGPLGAEQIPSRKVDEPESLLEVKSSLDILAHLRKISNTICHVGGRIRRSAIGTLTMLAH